MTNFDDILASLHDTEFLADEQLSSPIVITSRRAYEVPQNYDLVLGYAGDVNSQIVTFQLPKKHEEHELSGCSNQKLKWKNLTSGAEGISNLIIDKIENITWTAMWLVPPEAMTVAGKLEIAISIYDVDKEGVVFFAWNTPPYKEFSIGEGFIKVADEIENNDLPAKDEILIVDVDNRNIVAPVGYNTIACSYGDIGMSKLFFEINQYIHGINLLDEATKIYINIVYETITAEPFKITNIKPMFVQIENKKTNKVLLTWDMPAALTNNSQKYIGTFSISIKIEVKNDNGELVKRWSTSSFDKLRIGPSVLLNTATDIVPRDEEIVERLVEQEVDEVIDNKIDSYMDNTYFITNDNE